MWLHQTTAAFSYADHTLPIYVSISCKGEEIYIFLLDYPEAMGIAQAFVRKIFCPRTPHTKCQIVFNVISIHM